MTGDENVVPITAADKTARKPRPPAPGRVLYPAPDAPLEVARELYKKFRTPTGRTLVCHRGDWMRWTGQQWNDWDTAHLRSTVYKRLGEVDYDKPIRKGGEIVDHERTPWNPNKHKVANVLEALAAVAHLGAEIDAPAWITDHQAAGPADEVIACTNGLLSLATRELHEHTPAFYNHVSVPFAYQADAPEPASWLEFLASVWPDDPASIALLQEWIGYIVTGRTDMQKILLLIGPTRSGKGTSARLIRNLIGHGHVTGPTLASLGTNFGLAPLMGKPLAVIADARLGGRDIHTIVERLLSISGEDVLTVDRKFRDPWSGKLPTRLMILSNEIPRFADSSGAIANRLLVLQMRNSFLGKEDRTLDTRIAAELPGILNWALEGLDRLATKGRFTVPASSREATTMLMDLASPVSAFVRDCCIRGVGQSVERDRLYNAWKTWCFDNGHEAGAKATFGRNLNAAVPDLGTTKPRINGVQIRCYTSIGLLAASPAPHGINAVQDTQGEAQRPDSPQQEFPIESGPDASPTDANAQVNGSETGGTPEIALSPVLQSAKQKLSCQKWLNTYIEGLRSAGHSTASSLAVYAAGEAEGYRIDALRTAASKNKHITVVSRAGGGSTWDLTGTMTQGHRPAHQWVSDYLDGLPDGTTTIDREQIRQAAEASEYSWTSIRHAAITHPRIESVPAEGNSTVKRLWIIQPNRDGAAS